MGAREGRTESKKISSCETLQTFQFVSRDPTPGMGVPRGSRCLSPSLMLSFFFHRTVFLCIRNPLTIVSPDGPDPQVP